MVQSFLGVWTTLLYIFCSTVTFSYYIYFKGHIGEGGDAVKNGRRQESPGGERTGGSRADNSASGEARVTSSSKVKGRAASVGNEVGF